MNLDKVKQKTTWNDASGSINSNFEKIRQAIVSLLGGGGGAKIEIDSEMSDTSENAVQNKVVKQYVDQLRADLDAIVNGDASAAIESINEILAFLSTIEDTTTLEGIIAGLKASMEKYTDEEIEHIEGVLNERIDGIVHVVYYYDGLSEEHKAENKKAYDAIMAGIDSCYVITDKTSSTKIIATAALKSSTIAGLMAYQIMPTSKDEITIGLLSLSLYEDGSTKQTTTQSYVLNREAVIALLSGKQDVLVSGTTIKTINGESILGEGDLIIQGGTGGAEVRTLFVNEALTSDELSYNAETIQLIFAQHPMIFFASAEEGTPLSEYELMGMDNGRMVFAKYELNEYSTGATYIYLAMDGSTEVGGFSNSELDGDKYDKYLDADSANAVQNKVVTENIRALEAAMPLMAVIDLDTIIAQDTPIDTATRNALLELGGYTSGDKYFSKGWIWSRGYLYTVKVIPTDAGVQIHVLSLKGWCEILEDNSKVNHLPSQGGGSIEVDSELSEVSENAVSNKAVTMALAETEEVTAAALNELNERFEEYATKEDIAATLAEMDEEINHIEGVLEATIIEDEEVAAAALVSLDKRVTNLEQNGGGGNSGGGEGGGTSDITIDSALSTTSTNPVQNKIITTELNKKVDAVSGKGLSTNDYTTTEKNKLSGIASGAEVNVQSDWNATSGDAFIKNKPTFATINGQRIDQGGEITIEGGSSGSGSGEVSGDFVTRTEIVENESVIATALTDIDERLVEVDTNIAENNDAIRELNETLEELNSSIIENEGVIATTLIDLRDRIQNTDDNLTQSNNEKSELAAIVEELISRVAENERVMATALTDLNERMQEMFNNKQ